METWLSTWKGFPLINWSFSLRKTVILETLRFLFGYLGHHFGDPGVQGDTQWTPWGPDLHFIDFGMDLGTLLESTLGTISWLSVIWGGRMGDRFQVHVFSDPGMEMMPECNGCMCYNHSKNNVFWMISLLLLIHWFGVLRQRFRSHFDSFWWPWDHLFWFLRVLEIGLKIEVPWGSQGWGNTPKWR